MPLVSVVMTTLAPVKIVLKYAPALIVLADLAVTSKRQAAQAEAEADQATIDAYRKYLQWQALSRGLELHCRRLSV